MSTLSSFSSFGNIDNRFETSVKKRDSFTLEVFSDNDKTWCLSENGIVYRTGNDIKNLYKRAFFEALPFYYAPMFFENQRGLTPLIKKMFIGRDFQLFIDNDDALIGLGRNDFGQLKSLKKQIIVEDVPHIISENVIDAGAGYYHTIYLEKSGEMFSLGKNNRGQLGKNNIKSTSRPIFLMRNIISVFAAGNSSFAIDKDGVLYAWGDNSYGQLGIKKVKYQKEPKKIMKNIVDVFPGAMHTFVLSRSGAMYAFGNNDYGQLGINTNGKTQDRPSKIGKFNSASAGRHHSALIDENGNLFVCGSNTYNQLGKSDIKSSRKLIKVYSNVAKVSCGDKNTVAFLEEDNIIISGDNSYGQLATGNLTKQSGFVKIQNPANKNPREEDTLSISYFVIMDDKITALMEASKFLEMYGDINGGSYFNNNLDYVRAITGGNSKAIEEIEVLIYPNKISYENVKYTYKDLQKASNKLVNYMNNSNGKDGCVVTLIGIDDSINGLIIGLESSTQKTQSVVREKILKSDMAITFVEGSGEIIDDGLITEDIVEQR